jgi:hypothetical protein
VTRTARAFVRRCERSLVATLLLAAAVAVPCSVEAQVRRDTTARRDSLARRDSTARDTIRAPGDTVGRDSTAKLQVQWADPDSVMQELMSREGYVTTKYQGERVELRAKDKTIRLDRDRGRYEHRRVAGPDRRTGRHPRSPHRV